MHNDSGQFSEDGIAQISIPKRAHYILRGGWNEDTLEDDPMHPFFSCKTLKAQADIEGLPLIDCTMSEEFIPINFRTKIKGTIPLVLGFRLYLTNMDLPGKPFSALGKIERMQPGYAPNLMSFQALWVKETNSAQQPIWQGYGIWK